jgi:hypothetical protein
VFQRRPICELLFSLVKKRVCLDWHEKLLHLLEKAGLPSVVCQRVLEAPILTLKDEDQPRKM